MKKSISHIPSFMLLNTNNNIGNQVDIRNLLQWHSAVNCPKTRHMHWQEK